MMMLISFIDFRAVVVIAVALTAVAFDVRTRRIPNYLTLGAAGAALVYGFASGGFAGLGHPALGWLLGGVIFFPFFALGGMGAGDVKLLAALGAWLGPAEAAWLALFASIAGGAVAVFVSLSHGYLRQALVNVWLMLMHWRIAGPRPMPGLTLRDAGAPRLAYAIPIAIGVLCTLWRR
jgi:prepilin peptidase CpaA